MEESNQLHVLHEEQKGDHTSGTSGGCLDDDKISETEDTDMENASDSDISEYVLSYESDNYSDFDISEQGDSAYL